MQFSWVSMSASCDFSGQNGLSRSLEATISGFFHSADRFRQCSQSGRFGRRGRGAAQGQLREQHTREHQPAPQQPAPRQRFVKRHPAAQRREDGFQTQDDGGMRRRSVPLGHDLQRVGDPDRQ